MLNFLNSVSLIHSVEDLSRLEDCFQQFGLRGLQSRNQKKFFEVLSRGLRLQARYEPNSRDWSDAIADLAKGEFSEDLGHRSGESPFSALSQTILDQPAGFLSAQQHDDCLAFASKVALAICLKLVHLDPRKTCHWIRQLFKSSDEDWARVRSQLHRDQELTADHGHLKQVVQDFIAQKQKLLHVSPPPISSFLTTADTRSLPLQKSLSDAQPVEVVPTKLQKVPKPPDDVSPDYHLFEAQILRSMHPDISDGHRLPNNWNRQSSAEMYPTIQRLLTQLRQCGEEHRRPRVHAAARFISLFCGLSLKTCLTLPIGWGHRKSKGTMHLDLRCGILRRDALRVATRKSRPGKSRTNGRWWRVQIPPEVIAALVEAFTKVPEASTLGELVHAAGLNHESCQHLLNDDLPTSHRPEDARLANSFRTCLLDLGVHPAMVARASGDISTTPFSDHFYLTFSAHQVHSAIAAFCDWAGLVAPARPSKDRTTGSPKSLSLQDFQKIVQHLNQRVITERNKVTARSNIKTIVDFHNLYTKAFVLQCILAHGGRGNLIGRLTFARLFASNDYLALSDRRTDPYSRQRILPLTPLMADNNRRYLEHLHALSKRIKPHAPMESTNVEDIANGRQLHNPAFILFHQDEDGWIGRSLMRSDLVELLATLGFKIGKQFDHESLNIARHFWQTELVNQQVAQPAVESFCGHHTNGAEVFGFGSGISVREVCDYLRPKIQRIQETIGFIPLLGLGRTANRYLQLPIPAVQRNLRPLPSKLLLQKLEHQDLVIPDVTLREQDPPSTSKTLVAHSTLTDLRKRYLRSSLVSTYSIGAAMFGLVAFELVLSESEQTALFMAAVSDGLWQIGEMCVVEAEHKSRPIAQRILQEPTQAAIFKARATWHRQFTAGKNGSDIAVDELHKLLIALTGSWPCRTAPESLKLLSILASHWAAIEIAPGTLFGVFHKAPFIPAKDLARLFHKQPRAYAAKTVSTPDAAYWSKDPRFKDTDKILKKWANKDIRLGEWHSRAEGCSKELSRYLLRGDLSLAERMHAELLVADLSKTPPYKTLDSSTLPAYSNKYQRFFRIVQVEDSCDLEPEHFMQAYRDMGGGADMSESALPRWAMLHICAFLSSRGHWVPAALTANSATKTPRPARIPVYTSTREIELVGLDLVEYFENCGGTYTYARPRLQLERRASMRAGELRYARPIDFDMENCLFHITTSGHDHLKNTGSHGTVPFTDAEGDGLVGLKRLRQSINVGYDTLMFADAHLDASYQTFDEITAATRKFVISRTACSEFRRHDFRSSASTDVCFEVEQEIERLGSGARFAQNCANWTSSALTERFIRFAKSARFSRHASIATTLRYYNCSGPLDLHQQLELSATRLPVSGIHAAEVIGMSSQNLYVLKDRRSERDAVCPGDKGIGYRLFVSEHLIRLRRGLNTPPLRGPSTSAAARTTRARAGTSFTQVVHACLLATTGLPLTTAAGALNLLPDAVASVHARTMKFMGSHFPGRDSKDSAPALSSRLDSDVASVPLGASIKSLSRWLTSSDTSRMNWGLAVRLSMGSSNSTLAVVDAVHLEQILPILKGISRHGFRVFFRPSTGVIVSSISGLSNKLSDAGVEVYLSRGKSIGFGSVQFCIRHEIKEDTSTRAEAIKGPEEISPRALGMAGRVVVFGLVTVMFKEH